MKYRPVLLLTTALIACFPRGEYLAPVKTTAETSLEEHHSKPAEKIPYAASLAKKIIEQSEKLETVSVCQEQNGVKECSGSLPLGLGNVGYLTGFKRTDSFLILEATLERLHERIDHLGKPKYELVRITLQDYVHLSPPRHLWQIITKTLELYHEDPRSRNAKPSQRTVEQNCFELITLQKRQERPLEECIGM